MPDLTLRLRGWDKKRIRETRRALARERARIRGLRKARASAKPDEKLNLPRHARNISRRRYKQLLGGRRRHFPPEVLLCVWKPRPLLDGIYPERKKSWRTFDQRRFERQDIDLSSFSFIEDPKRAMSHLQSIVAADCECVDVKLHFEDDLCLDLGAYLILQAVRSQLLPVYTGGRISESMGKVFKLLKLDSAMEMNVPVRRHDAHNIWPFPLQRRRPANTSKSRRRHLDPQAAERVVKELVTTLNRWLGRIGELELSDVGENIARKMVGEVLGNAEQHSADEQDGNWSVAGFLTTRKIDGRDRYVVQLALFSPGRTISESLQSCAPETQEVMANYVRKHAKGEKYTAEMLRTVFALQDGVTSDAKAFEKSIGGTGLQDVLRFFADLSEQRPDGEDHGGMAIVSGSTCLLLKRRYKKGIFQPSLIPSSGEPARVLWFNEENSHDYPPDLDYVHHLPGKLQGTLLSMAIVVDEDYLRSANNG